MHIDDVRMAEFASLADLIAQEIERLRVKGFLQDLDCDGFTGDLLIPCQVHHPHPALAELSLDPVSTGKHLTDDQPLASKSTPRLWRLVRGCVHALDVHTAGPADGRGQIRFTLRRWDLSRQRCATWFF